VTQQRIPLIDATIDVVGITGGRWYMPGIAQLRAIVSWLTFNDVKILVHGDCNRDGDNAKGVDAIVSAYVARETSITVEPWPALRGRYGSPAAGPRRNGKMLMGDRRDWGGEDLRRPVHMLIAWPGGDGTSNCVRQAEGLGIDVITIADVERLVREHEARS
jgi:hypothetical protein